MPLTILVADDDLGTRLSISDYLEAVGYSVIAAENGREALKLVEEFQPHLLVADINMPQMDGYELLKHIRQRPASRLLPVVLLTTRSHTHDRILGYQAGCDVYLPKPFELQELGAVIRNLLERLQILEAEWRSTRDTRSQDTAVTSGKATDIRSATPDPADLVALNLTQREQDVLKVLTTGLSNMQIGDHLHLSPRTVEKYVSSLLRKTETNNRAELVRFAIERRLVQ
ncbi:response regulator transcription factor [Leptolyngbya sp. FACHB-36]|uniref:response regulator transcription factor n=1 Tax=Leptolyngbya sp. FACHB-36 TaxID=2692808 RepID=UPI001680C1D9|nr:response regulator transcription factor [Leptolyngbya sp. FACHB-36]MBD2022111.1 response regulator transcription factor [Leptolyngbya sp. FACHB-36]